MVATKFTIDKDVQIGFGAQVTTHTLTSVKTNSKLRGSPTFLKLVLLGIGPS